MNALTKFSVALLLITATAIAAYLFLAPSDEGFDAALWQPQDATSSQPQDGICKRDEERLARLRANPSLEEGLSFVSEIRCLRLWPELQTIMDGLGNPSRATATSRLSGAASDTTPASDVASPPGTTSAAFDDACKHDEDRLAELRANPSVAAAIRFDAELKCPKLQPQLPAVLTQLGRAAGSVVTLNQKAPTPDPMPTTAAAPPAASPPALEVTSATSDPPNSTSAGETALPALETPAATSPMAAPGSNKSPLSTAAVGETAPPASALATSEAASAREAQTSTQAPANTASVGEAEPGALNTRSETSNDACKQDEDLARLRQTPSSEKAARFSQELRCETLRPELLALTGELAKPRPTQTDSVSNEARGARNAASDAQPLSLAIADAERRIAALESDKVALAAEVSTLQRNQVPPSAEQPPQPAPPAERSEPQPSAQAIEDAERRIAALESEKEALAAEVSKLQHDREAPYADQTTPTPSPQPASPAERPGAEAASKAATDAERRIAELEREKVALTAEVGKLQRDRGASSAEQAKPIPPPSPVATAERSDAESAAALASLPEGMQARVLIRYLNNADARAQAEKLASTLTAQGVEVADVRESHSAIRTELSFSYAPDEAIARQVGRVVRVAPVRRLQPKDGLMLRPGTVELNLSGDSHLAAIKTTSTRESNHE
jgi:cell division protein FtsB